VTDAGDASVVVGLAPYDSADAQRLIAALDVDLIERYAADVEDESDVDWSMLTVHPEAVAAPHGAFLIARVDGAAVGCVALRPAPTGEPDTGELKRMYVAPTARGRGVSRRLLVALEHEAAVLGYRRIVLETGIRQPEAMALYESAGYEPIDSYGAYRTSPISRCYGKTLGTPVGPSR
jgi:GNAT superfamily N-acetyltransferase